MVDVKGYEGIFKITTCGKLISVKSGKILKTSENKRGYLVYNSRGKRVRIHRAVAEAYLDNPCGLPVVNHKDGDKQNNSVYNLEWVTFSENTKHAYMTGLVKRVNSSGSRARD